MAHPWHHSRSSALTHGGEPDEYLPLHQFFDQSKGAWAESRHRAVLHSIDWGAERAEARFGALWVTSGGRAVPVRELARQHVLEDLGFAAALSDWLRLAPPLTDRALSLDQHCRLSARRFGGTPEDYETLHRWMDRPRAFWDDPRADAATHTAFGIFLAEAELGVTLTRPSDGTRIPVRLLAETHVIADLGRIPTLQDALGAITREPWMDRAALPLSRILGTAEDLRCSDRCAGCPAAVTPETLHAS